MLRVFRKTFNRYSIAYEYFLHTLVLMLTFVGFFLLDYLTKKFLFNFDPDKQNISVSYGIIGLRSFPHKNTTILSFLNWKIDPQFVAIFSMFILIIITIWALNVKRKLSVFWLMVVCAGIFGNSIDFLRLGFVMDIIYLPWFDRGTFNVADVLIVVGAIGCVLTFVINELRSKTINETII